MRVAFYAPLKPPDHPVPSGDRAIARALMHALRRTGHDVELASTFRSWEGAGDRTRQARLRAAGERHAERCLGRIGARGPGGRPDVWFTYHLYHKAPDWLGPKIARDLGIPYVVAEASVAPKQANGPWADGYDASLAAVRQAERVVVLNSDDLPGLARARGGDRGLIRVPPFLDLAAVVSGSGNAAGAPTPFAIATAPAGPMGSAPEPTTLAIVAAGLMMIGLRRRGKATNEAT